jgi:flagellar biosynthesis protein FliP
MATPFVLSQLDPSIQLVLTLASLSLLPFIVVSMTSFLRFIIVLSVLKTALGTQQVPPAIVLVGLALIMTLYTMGPVLTQIGDTALPVLQKKQGSVVEAMAVGSEPLKQFMLRQTRQSDMRFFLELSRKTMPNSPKDLHIFEVAPAFMISELRTAFEIGFVLFIPFIVVDIVVSNILLALGMMMLSPTVISLPFKILIFVAVDGWAMVVGGLIKSFN